MNVNDSTFLRDERLFAIIPSDSVNKNDTSVASMLKECQKESNFQKLIDLTYSLLQNHDSSIGDKLKVWEARLSLHLFNNNISYAKSEAIQLNNALFLRENNNHPPNQPSPKMPIVQHNHPKQIVHTVVPVYSLPKNNDGAIEHTLLTLILRLKSSPNMNLINDLYKLCYQLRLKSSTYNDKSLLLSRIINLSYNVMAILLKSRNYLTLLNYIKSMRHDLKLQEKNGHISDKYKQCLSNISLMLILVTAHMLIEQKIPFEKVSSFVAGEYESMFESEINEATLTTFENSAKKLQVDDFASSDSPGLRDILRILQDPNQSFSILTSTLGIWDVYNVLSHKATNSVPVAEESSNSKINTIYTHVLSLWESYPDKVFDLY